MEDVVTSRFDYSQLDREGANVRLRLNSTAVKVTQLSNGHVEVTYVKGDRPSRVRAKRSVLACYNRMIPSLCPELPEGQREALRYNVKVPLVYTNVLIRNWTSFQKLGVRSVFCPAGYHHSVSLDFPVSLGDYSFSISSGRRAPPVRASRPGNSIRSADTIFFRHPSTGSSGRFALSSAACWRRAVSIRPGISRPSP